MSIIAAAVNWTAVSAICSIAGVCVNFVIAFSLVLSARVLREAERSRESSILVWALDRMQEIRPLMHELRANRNLEWQLGNIEKVLKVLSVMNIISYMAENKLILGQRLIDMWGRSIVEQWILLETFIRTFRTRIGEPELVSEGAYYARSFERFAIIAQTDLNQRFSIHWPKPTDPNPGSTDSSMP
ncbi:MAG TPA: hypothetical protein VFC39_07330 [Acidobacteriaceae bacterium]|nr:hypothetical protein [Acidobacteriaceae bacterium]